MEKFAAMSGFGGVPSARANIGRLLAKLSAEGDASGFQSPTKGDDEEETAPETPVTGKKKGTGRKRKGGEIWFASHARARLTSSVDAVEGNTAEDTPVKKKKATPSKAKGKALANAAKSEDEPSPIKEEVVDEASEEGA
jgi:hypothetical protein